VLVAEGDAVRAGAVVVRFDDTRQRAELAAAAARVAEARARVADLRAGTRPDDLARAAALVEQQRAQYELARRTEPYQTTVVSDQLRQAQARLAQAQAGLRDAHANAERMRNLFATGDVSAQQRDAAVERESTANAQVGDATAAVNAARAQLQNAARVTLPRNADAALAAYRAAQAQYRELAAGARPDQIAQAQAAVRAAEGAQVQARKQLDESVVRSPESGVVSAINLHPGDLVAAGSSVATIDEAGDPFVRIYVPQSALAKFAVGTKLAVHPDAAPGATFAGVVEAVDARAQFTPQNVQTESDRAGLSFGVKVRITDREHRLHGGTTVGVAFP
jgi:HlyD family secretion protein